MKRIKKYIDDNGDTWDSKSEYLFYCYLLNNKENFNIKEIHRQVVYEIQEGFMYMNNKVQRITYKSDFTLMLNNGQTVIIDVKPPVKNIWDSKFPIKWKMMKYKYRDYIYKIVAFKNKNIGWIEM